jgi:hypothetical protein
MVRIPTPIPQTVIDFLKWVFNRSVLLALWRITVISVALFFIAGAFAYPQLFILFAVVLGPLYYRGLRQTALDILNLDFWWFGD